MSTWHLGIDIGSISINTVVLDADRDGLIVGCGADAVAFGELQLPGKKRMPAQALLAGHPLPRGTRLGLT